MRSTTYRVTDRCRRHRARRRHRTRPSRRRIDTRSSPTATSRRCTPSGVRNALDPSRVTGAHRFRPASRHKTRETWAAVDRRASRGGFGRDTTIIALGGGVVGDLAGFVAATFMRGVPFVQVPTTLLAMIDASVGGKTGVDTPAGKNLVGAFHQPAAVIADPAVLATLPIEHLRAGLAEAIKHGVIADAAYFDSVASIAPRLGTLAGGDDRAARRSSRAASRSRPTWCATTSASRVCGRCSTSATRSDTRSSYAAGYSLLHGEAVAIGMVYESALAERLGIAQSGTMARIREVVVAAGLPDARPASISVDAILDAARGDKKARAGKVEYALPLAIGSDGRRGPRMVLPVSDGAVREILA